MVGADGRLAGIVSRADVLAVFDRTSEEIGEDIGQVISREVRYDPRQFTVTVRSGVVTLQGSPETATLGRDIVHKVRHVPAWWPYATASAIRWTRRRAYRMTGIFVHAPAGSGGAGGWADAALAG